MVFQAYTLFPWLTVAQNVEYGPKRKGIPAAARKEIVDHYLAEIGLTKFANHYPSQLSGGMKQRVAIARALANDPEVLLMDEPFGALDSQTRHSMQKLLLRVWEHSKKTVLFVTHDIDEAILLADRVLVMSGRPGLIKKEIKVDIPRPRTGDLVLEPEFIAMKREILALLKNDEELVEQVMGSGKEHTRIVLPPEQGLKQWFSTLLRTDQFAAGRHGGAGRPDQFRLYRDDRPAG